MNEHTFVRAVHNALRAMKPRPFIWKINARAANGAPDAWYSGPKGDLWAEYKWLHKVPKRHFDPVCLMTPLQYRWIDGRAKDGRNVVLIVGMEGGAMILNRRMWNSGRITQPFNLLTPREIAEWIHSVIATPSFA